MRKCTVITTDISTGSYQSYLDDIDRLAEKRTSSYVCVANVHMAIEAWKDKSFSDVINSSDITVPDGMPLAKSVKILTGKEQERAAGMDMMPDILERAGEKNFKVYLYGSTTDILECIVDKIEKTIPKLEIAGICSPPFRSLTEQEETDIVSNINESGANIVLVALGCPKQEKWMANNKGKINSVMIGVGGAFPVYAGKQKRAPKWMQNMSLEWFYRLCQEPARLCKRYFVTNTLFLGLIFWEILSNKLDLKTSVKQ